MIQEEIGDFPVLAADMKRYRLPVSFRRAVLERLNGKSYATATTSTAILTVMDKIGVDAYYAILDKLRTGSPYTRDDIEESLLTHTTL